MHKSTEPRIKALWALLSVVLALAIVMPAVPVLAYGDMNATVSAGEDHTMFIKADGSLWACGSNYGGLLGVGTAEKYYYPVKVMGGVATVSAGYSYTMAVKKDGSLWAWGTNRGGQLGIGSAGTECNIPTKVMDGVASVSAGFGVDAHTMILKTDGSLWATGNNYHGQFGNGTTKDSLIPVKVMDSVFCVSAGESHTMAIKTNGELWGWGFNGSGAVGDGTDDCRISPVKIMDGVVSVSAGGAHTMAIKEDGSLWAWGISYTGALGVGPVEGDKDLPPVKVLDGALVMLPPVGIFLNGRSISLDVPPQVISGRVMLPFRAVSESLGVKVDWSQSAQTITATKGGTVVTLPIGSVSPTVNGHIVTIEVPATIVGGRALVPLRFFAEAFNVEVDWDEVKRTVYMTSR